jgi:tetratricopeptide (TPR) repeat protein
MRIENLRDLLSQLADVDGPSEDLSQSEIKIRESLMLEDRAGSPQRVELLTQLARVQGLLGKLTEAGATLLLANEALSKHSEPGSERAKVKFLIEQGRFFGLSMNPSQSLSYFAKAWELASQTNEVSLSIEAAVHLSISQPPKFQNEWLQRSLKLAEATDDEKGKLWLAPLYILNGWHLFDFRKYEEALTSFEKGVKLQVAEDGAKTLRARWSVGRTLRALNRIPEALAIQQGLKVELAAAGQVNGHVYLEIGECLQLMKNHDEAKVNFELAYKELSLNGWYTDNKQSELSRIQHLSKKK